LYVFQGYPYWPSVVTRDPADGEFVKVPDFQFKKQRVLDYNNQRAWFPSISFKEYKWRQEFQAEAAKAGPNCRIKNKGGAAEVRVGDGVKSLAVQKQKKRKTVRDREVEVNKSTDSEADYQANMACRHEVECPG
jgi:hypothetical protein